MEYIIGTALTVFVIWAVKVLVYAFGQYRIDRRLEQVSKE